MKVRKSMSLVDESVAVADREARLEELRALRGAHWGMRKARGYLDEYVSDDEQLAALRQGAYDLHVRIVAYHDQECGDIDVPWLAEVQ
jgi:hypothetical protein